MSLQFCARPHCQSRRSKREGKNEGRYAQAADTRDAVDSSSVDGALDFTSITRQEFNEACAALAAQGVPLKPDLDQAWIDFAGWRVNYDQVLLLLCSMTMAPSARWSADRAPAFRIPRLFGQR